MAAMSNSMAGSTLNGRRWNMDNSVVCGSLGLVGNRGMRCVL